MRAAFDNPDLIVAYVVGDGEAEIGTLATSWHSKKLSVNGMSGAPVCWPLGSTLSPRAYPEEGTTTTPFDRG